MTKLFAGVVALLFAGCFQHVVRDPKPEADVDFYALDQPVAPGTPLAAMVTWEGWCEYDKATPRIDDGGNNEYPCSEVDHAVAITCEGNACTWTDNHNTGYDIIPTKVGTMNATVVVTRKSDGRRTVRRLHPVEIAWPDTFTATCQKVNDGAFVDVGLSYRGKQVQIQDVTIRIKGGPECRWDGVPYHCPITAAGPTVFEASAVGFTLEATADCG